ncbi:MAG: alpha/beta hydrolase family protein [Phycisphaerae bacterium]
MKRILLCMLAGLCGGCPDGGDPPAGPDVTHQPFRAPVAVVSSDVMLLTDTPPPRVVRIRLYSPAGPAAPNEVAHPLVLVSPDAGRSARQYAWLGKHLASQGYLCVVIEHGEVREGASARRQRAGELSFVLDRLSSRDFPAMLKIAPDSDRVAVVGHGAGAETALLAAGLAPDANEPGEMLVDRRLDAVVALDPPPSGAGGFSEKSFASVSGPSLLIDAKRQQDANVSSAAFEALPEGLAFHLVVPAPGGDAFLSPPGSQRQERSPIHLLWVGQTVTAFLDASLRQDREALRWLMDRRIETFSRGACRIRHR